jgi:hypothetical protein
MKNLNLTIFLLPLSVFSQHDFKIETRNLSKIQEIDGRSVLFGVKEKTEEMLIEKGWVLSDTFNPSLDIDRDGSILIVNVSIDAIESPHQILNIVGTKWLKKEYIVTSTIRIPGSPEIYSTAIGKRTNFLFAAFLDVEGNEIPLNRKSFSKSLESSLKKCTEKI